MSNSGIDVRGYAAIGLTNPKTNFNVGGAIRAAHCYGAGLIMIKGQRYHKTPADTTKAPRHIPLIHVEDFHKSNPYDCVPVAVEIHPGAHDIRNYVHPERAFYIFGPEDGTLGKATLSKVRDIIFIPTAWCMNLAATVNVVLFDRMVKRGVRKASDAKIQKREAWWEEQQ